VVNGHNLGAARGYQNDRIKVGTHVAVTINSALAREALDQLGLDALGLDATDRGYLMTLVTAGRALGVESLAATLGENRETLETVVEPFLLQLGLIVRTARGRTATETGREHLAEVTT
jgi:Holliday junction DNA helicase RuvB